jgi:hypothetical protein
MKDKFRVSFIFVLFVSISIGVTATGDMRLPSKSVFQKSFDLVGERSAKTQYFVMETKLMNYALNGTIIGTDIYRLHLKCIPARLVAKQGDEYTCMQFEVQLGNKPAANIPALENWSYVYKNYLTGKDEKGQVLGIDHSKFENLKDKHGNKIEPDSSYHVYNTFIDFHSLCNAFAEETSEGKGIQDLKQIGQKIIHAAAFTEPPVNVGSNVSKGSFFKNGEITLGFTGLSMINNKLCAIIGYDSGASSFKIIMHPTQDMEIQTVGSSHYKGDIYIDTDTKWVQKAVLDEVVISETNLPMPPNKINIVTERDIVIRNVSEKEFLKQIKN